MYSIVFSRVMSSYPNPNLRRYFTDPLGRKDHSYYEKLSLEDKRKEYKCGNRYKILNHIIPWSEWRLTQKFCSDNQLLSEVNQELNKKVSIWQGDITHLEIDAIVNAANRSLLGGGGVDGAIHGAAGWSLRDECEKLNGCESGNTKLTSGHRLPAKYILHTVGPMSEDRSILKSCYETCLQLVDEYNIKSVAFCCVATGIYGYPNEAAAHVALETVRSWLEVEDHHQKIEQIIFCVFLDIDYKIYQRLMQLYFPRDQDIPSVEMLEKRLNSLKEIPTVVEDDPNLTEENKESPIEENKESPIEENEESPMDTEENTQSVSGALKATPPSEEECSKDGTQQDVSNECGGQSDELGQGSTTNIDTPTPSGDDTTPQDEEKVDESFSERDQVNNSLSLEENQKDNVSSPEHDSVLSEGPSNLQPQDPSSVNDNQLPSCKENLENDGTPTLKESEEDDTTPPPDSPKSNEETLNTQDPLSPMDTSSADQSLNNRQHSSEGDDQPPVLQRSVTGPAKLSGTDEKQ